MLALTKGQAGEPGPCRLSPTARQAGEPTSACSALRPAKQQNPALQIQPDDMPGRRAYPYTLS